MMSWDQPVLGTQAAAESAARPIMDSARFTAFYERSARPLWAYLLRCSADPALAEDLMQEAYVRFLGANPPADDEQAARRYLFRIASNLLRDHWRRPKASSLEDLPEAHFASSSNADDLATQRHLAQALEHLRPRDRQILWLAYAENYSHREIADIMGLAAASVRILLFRARHRMRDFLEAK